MRKTASRSVWLLGALAVAGVAAGLATLASSTRTTRGEPFDQYLVKAPSMSLRVTAYREKGWLLPVQGAFFSYECQAGPGQPWREVATFRHDDQVPIPRDQVRLVSDEVAYFFIGWVYGVTRDAGRTWTVWDAERDLQGWQPADYGFIRSVALAADGSGVMSTSTLRFAHSQLVTTDFGRTWQPATPTPSR